MRWMALIGASIVILACLGGFFLGWKNFIAIWKSYQHYLKEIAENTWVVVCGVFVRSTDSLLMKNNGDNPCEIKDSIPYINYIEDMSLFFEVTE